MSSFWALQRERFRREVRAHERFVWQIEHDTTMRKKQRRRRLHGAIRERDLARSRLRLVELFAAYRVPVPTELSKLVGLAKHFDRCARSAAYSGDVAASRDWSNRCRETLRDAWLAWSTWNAHTKKPAEAGSNGAWHQNQQTVATAPEEQVA